MKIVISPNQFPYNIDYKILVNEGDENLLRKIIEICCPSSRFNGFIDPLSKSINDDSIISSSYFVICNSNWAQIILDLEINYEKLILFPIPKGDEWGYWEFFKKNIHLFNIDNDQISISEENWKNMLIQSGRTSLFPKSWWRQIFYRMGLKIRKSHLKGILKFYPIIEELSPVEENLRNWGAYLNNRSQIKHHIKEINYIRTKLSNQRSQDSFMKLFSGNPVQLWENYLNGLLTSVQYFEYLPIDTDDVIINCGIFNGSEIPLFLAHLNEKGTIHNVDPLGYDYLDPYVLSYISTFRNSNIEHRIALHDYSGKLSLSVGGGGQAIGKSANMSIGNKVEYECLTLEEFIRNNKLEKIDIIKFDLEGSEEFVVPTMSDVIKEFRPKLAISIYHKVEHLWDLPILLINMCEKYNFYLNIYSWDRFEVILYCIPIERDFNNNPDTVPLNTTFE